MYTLECSPTVCSPNAAVGTRIMDVAAAGAPLVQNVDVFASVGRLKTASTTKTVTPQGAALQISLTASVRAARAPPPRRAC